MRFTGHSLIKQFEGLRLNAYKCSANVWTIGYGHTGNVNESDTITLQEAKDLLESDLEPFCDGINRVVTVDLTQNQFNALVSLAYNIGLGNFKSSTLLRLLNSGDYLSAANEFPKWRKADGKIIAGLETRRKIERELFLT